MDPAIPENVNAAIPENINPVIPENMDAAVQEVENNPEELEAAPAADDGPDAEKPDDVEAPASTSNSAKGSRSSSEEPTVEEVCHILATIDVVRDEERKGDSAERDTISRLFYRLGHNMILIWFSFWAIALVGGVFAYYLHKNQTMIAHRLVGDTTEELNLLLMPRERWDDSAEVVAKPTSYKAQRVVVLQTDTETCDTTTTCSRLLNAMKRKEGALKYNFLVATDGCIYEALGWQEPSPFYPDKPTMVIGFIGNYDLVAPSNMQLSQFQSLLEASEELKYLVDTYSILGRKQNLVPSKLFAYLSALDNWDKQNSDTDEQYIDVDFEPFPFFDQ